MEEAQRNTEWTIKELVRRGDIWNVNLQGLDNEVKENRYCIVVSNDIVNRFTDKITIIPLST